MKCDELEIKYVGYGMGFYPTEDVDAAIAELKDDKAQAEDDAAYWRKQYDEETKLTAALKDDIAELKAMVTTDNSAVIARLEAENAKLKSCIKCLVMRYLIKDCPEKESVKDLAKE